MPHRWRALAVAVVVAIGATALTSCSGGADAASTPTPTALFASEDEAFAAAEKTYRAYVDATNEVDLSDPATFENVYKWETADALAGDKKTLTALHAANATKSGTSRIQALTHHRAITDDDSVMLDVCLDVSSIDVRSKTNESLVKSSRPDVQKTTVILVPAQDSDSKMLISGIDGRTDGPTC